jgi:hypothetical protein
MAALSDFAENELLDHVLGTGSYTMPTQVYVALFTSATADAGTGTEVTGGSYARVAVDFTAASGGVTNPTADVEFPTASANWGTVTHIALVDASSSGNFLFHGALTASKTIETGDTLVIPAADLDVSLA